jgi:hypothetical protein
MAALGAAVSAEEERAEARAVELHDAGYTVCCFESVGEGLRYEVMTPTGPVVVIHKLMNSMPEFVWGTPEVDMVAAEIANACYLLPALYHLDHPVSVEHLADTPAEEEDSVR